jgi:hypothetical protein
MSRLKAGFQSQCLPSWSEARPLEKVSFSVCFTASMVHTLISKLKQSGVGSFGLDGRTSQFDYSDSQA